MAIVRAPTLEAALQINQLGKSWFLFGSLNFECRAVQNPLDAAELVRRIAVFSRGQSPPSIGSRRLHGELDVLRLQLAPALDFGLVSLFRKALEIFRGQLLSGRALPGEFLADKRVSWHGGFSLQQTQLANESMAPNYPGLCLSH